MEGGLDIWKILAGLGIFLFGMFLLEESVRNLAGRSFKVFLRKYTTGRIKSVLTGTVSTALLQSSSAVSLMVLAFVGAGIMTMENAIGVMLGSNAGTTATAWIVASLGFNVQIESFALPLIGIGGLGIIFLGSSVRYSNISKLLVGFGFLFMGLDYMKGGVEAFAESFAMDSLPDYGIIVYLLAGIVLTAIMQSSSATIAIVLTSLNAQLLTFEYAAVMVIGANIGTTITVFIGTIGGNQIKKRVASSHLVFNLVTAVLGLVLLYPLTWFIHWMVGSEPGNEVIGIALFHTLFNVMGVLLFLPFIPWLSKLLFRIVPEKNITHTQVIHDLVPEVTEAAIKGIHTEVHHLIKEVLRHNLSILQIDPKLVFGPSGEKERAIGDLYAHAKSLQAHIFTFATQVQESKLNKEETKELQRYLHAARLALHSTKSLKDVAHHLEDFESADNSFLNQEYANFRKRMIELYLKISTLLEAPHSEKLAGTLAHLLHRLRKEDQNFVRAATKAVSQQLVIDNDISDLLISNRAFIQSSQQLLNALQETSFTLAENEMFEQLTDPALETEGEED